MDIVILNINPDTKMADLIINNQQILYMLERFEIPLGFKDSTIKDLTNNHNIDINALLSIAQLIVNNESKFYDCTQESLKDILLFLENSHESFRAKVKSIKDLISAFSEDLSGQYEIILNTFFTEYSKDIEEHFGFEETSVFPYIKELYNFSPSGKNLINNIKEFEGNHSDTELKLKDLKNILIKYIPANHQSSYRNKILYHLYDLEPDLNLHAEVENKILIPLVKMIENDIKKSLLC